MNSNLNQHLSPEYREQGFKLEEQGDHILVLLCKGKEIARFSQTGVTMANIVKIISQDVSKN